MISPSSSIFSCNSSVGNDSEIGSGNSASQKMETIENLNEAANDKMQCCLNYFSYWGKSSSVSLLAHLGQNPSIQDSQGNVALHWAVKGNRPSTIKALVELGADNVQNYSGQTPVSLAKQLGYTNALKAFTPDVPAPTRPSPQRNSLYKLNGG